MLMRSVTRKAAVTAGLGAAIVAGAAAPALAATSGNAGMLNPQAPALPKVGQENTGLIGPFPVSQLTDKLPAGQLGQVGDVTNGLQSTAQQAQHSLPTGALNTGGLGLPGVGGLT
jgi:hypothetical protein